MRAANGEAGLATTVVRPGVIWGPGDITIVPRLAELLRRRQMILIDGGRNLLGLSHIESLARGLVLAAEAPGAPGRIYHMTDGEEITAREAVDALAAVLGVPAGAALAPLRRGLRHRRPDRGRGAARAPDDAAAHDALRRPPRGLPLPLRHRPGAAGTRLPTGGDVPRRDQTALLLTGYSSPVMSLRSRSVERESRLASSIVMTPRRKSASRCWSWVCIL